MKFLQGHAAGRLTIATSDQLLSSLTNIALVVIVAGQVSARQFGIFTFFYSAVVLLLGLTRAIVSQPMLLLRSSAKPSGPSPQAAFGLATIIGLASSLLYLPLALVYDQWALWTIMTVTVPILLAQDTGRFLALAEGTPVRALVSDSIWALLLALGLFFVFRANVTFSLYLVTWLISGAISSLPFLRRYGIPTFAISQLRAAIRVTAPASSRFVVEYLSVNGSAQIVLLMAGAITGPEGVGALRAVFSIFGPINTLAASVALGLLPEARRWAGQDRRALVHWASGGVAIGLALLSGLWLVILRGRLGEPVVALFGATAPGLRRTLLPIGIRYIATAFAIGALTSLRAYGRLQQSMPILFVSGIGQIAAALGLGVAFGLSGIVAGLALVEALTAGALWAMVRRPGTSVLPT